MIRAAETDSYDNVRKLLKSWSEGKEEIVNLSIWETDNGWKARVVSKGAKHEKRQCKIQDVLRGNEAKDDQKGFKINRGDV